jgi:hypothetical protein
MAKNIDANAGWTLLRRRYQERGIVLALGAGVSGGCLLPSWPELLKRMGDRCLGANGRTLVENLLAGGATLPAVAGILESRRPRGVEFLELLSRELYRDFPFSDAITTRTQRDQLVKFVHRNNSVLRAVAALCADDRDAKAVAANPRVHAVVNFNVDAILRDYMRARYGGYLLRTIETATKTQRLGRIPVYHMHGFLKFYRSRRVLDDEQPRCVFTEGEYYDFFNRPHSVFNYTFLYLLREYNCLFIGLSMNDENIRRLLHYSTAERRGDRADTETVSRERLAVRHFAILRRKPDPKLNDLIDLSLRRIGTRVLWVDDFAEIPGRLGTVYGSAAWTRVY